MDGPMSTEDKAVERAKGRIMELLDFDEPTPYLAVWGKVAATTNWKTFQRAMKELRADKKVHNFGGYRKH
jgi:hypothetical protein